MNRIKEGIEKDVVAAIAENIPLNNEKKLVSGDGSGLPGTNLILVAPKNIAHEAAVQTLNQGPATCNEGGRR